MAAGPALGSLCFPVLWKCTPKGEEGGRGEFRRLETRRQQGASGEFADGAREGRCCRGHHVVAEEAHRHESVCFVPLCLDCKPGEVKCLVLSRNQLWK